MDVEGCDGLSFSMHTASSTDVGEDGTGSSSSGSLGAAFEAGRLFAEELLRIFVGMLALQPVSLSA